MLKIMDTEELIEKYRRAQIHLQEVQARIAGNENFYEASIIAMSSEEQIRYRNELHALVDDQLDTVASIITIGIMISTA